MLWSAKSEMTWDKKCVVGVVGGPLRFESSNPAYFLFGLLSSFIVAEAFSKGPGSCSLERSIKVKLYINLRITILAGAMKYRTVTIFYAWVLFWHFLSSIYGTKLSRREKPLIVSWSTVMLLALEQQMVQTLFVCTISAALTLRLSAVQKPWCIKFPRICRDLEIVRCGELLDLTMIKEEATATIPISKSRLAVI